MQVKDFPETCLAPETQLYHAKRCSLLQNSNYNAVCMIRPTKAMSQANTLVCLPKWQALPVA